MRAYSAIIPVFIFAIYTTITTNKKMEEMYKKYLDKMKT
jgi:hypothetical protein